MNETAAISTSDKYGPSLPADECAQWVCDRIDRYRKQIKGSVLYPRWVQAFRTRHGLSNSAGADASVLGRRGSKGHRATVRTSTAAVDARHQLSIVAPLIPALDAIPVNTAYKTLAQVREGKRFFDYYVHRLGLGRKFYNTAENAQTFGVAWMVTDWDAFAGEPLKEPDPTQPNRTTTGAMVIRTHTPLDLVVDIHQDHKFDWFICRDKYNRWELAARYPSMVTEIMNLPIITDDDKWFGHDFRIDGLGKDADTDLVAVWTLHHQKTRALPQGRMLMVASASCWLFDGPYPYEDLAISEMSGGRIWNTPFGDSTLHHALGAQQALDRAMSAKVTNTLALGHQLVYIEDENFDLQEIVDGISAITGKAGPGGHPPQGISLLSEMPESDRTIEKLDGYIHQTLGVNSVIRGDPDPNVKSGAFGGLLVQQAAQYNSPAQFSFQRCVEDVGNKMLGILKRFADQPILAEISGPNGEWRLKEFTTEDYSGIHRLVAKPGNPAEQTAAFKKAKADSMLEAGLITSKQEYDGMIETNSSEMGTEDAEAEELNILLENEDMQLLADGGQPQGAAVNAPQMGPALPGPDGMPPPAILCPPVLATDNDALHVRKHAALLNSPQARGNAQLVTVVGAHNGWHMQNAATKPPMLAMMLGQPPPPPPPGSAPMGGAAPPGAGHPGPPTPEKGPGGVQAVRPVKPPPEATPQANAGP